MADEELAALLIDSVVDYAIFVLDPHGVVRSWNPGAERVKGYRPDEIIGRDFSTFYTEEDREAGLPARLLAQAAEQGRTTHSGWRVRKDGERFWADVTITALRDESGTLRGFAKVTRDRTEQYNAEIAMARGLDRERHAARELTLLGEARTRFLAAIAHDLGAPLAVIRGTLGMLDGDPEVLEVVERNVERLQSMTSQLSELSRLQRGRLDLHRQPLDLAIVVPDVVASIRPALGDLEVTVDTEGAVDADPNAFERVMVNLLSNAAVHAPDGTRIAVGTRTDGNGRVVVFVEDAGTGVAESERDLIFDEFRQGRHHKGRGLGLGLSIVRHYARTHGGEAWVEDADLGGARFCVALPTPDAA